MAPEPPIYAAEKGASPAVRAGLAQEGKGDVPQEESSEEKKQLSKKEPSDGVTGAETSLLSFGDDAESKNLELQSRVWQLRTDNKAILLENKKLREQKDTVISKFEDVETRLNQTFLENRRLKSLLAANSPHTDDTLARKFKSLFVKIESWCNEQTFNSGACSLSEQQLDGLKRSLGWGYVPDNLTLEARSSEIGRAYTSQILLERVFYTSPEDIVNIKDLWTGEREADHLTHLELRLMRDKMDSKDLEKWRSVTIASLANHPEDNSARIRSVSGTMARMLVGLFGIAEQKEQGKMQSELEEQILLPAIALSLDLRIHQPPLYVGIPKQLDDTTCSWTVHDPEKHHDKWALLRHKREKIYDVDVMVRPAMLKDGGRNGRQSVAVKCERFTIVTKGPAPTPN